MGQSSGAIYGKITDTNLTGEPLLFANVQLKGTSFVTQTNFHGNFEMTGIPCGTYLLQVNYLGYESKEIELKMKSDEIIIIEESLPPLSEQTKSLTFTEVSEPLNKVADKSLQP